MTDHQKRETIERRDKDGETGRDWPQLQCVRLDDFEVGGIIGRINPNRLGLPHAPAISAFSFRTSRFLERHLSIALEDSHRAQSPAVHEIFFFVIIVADGFCRANNSFPRCNCFNDAASTWTVLKTWPSLSISDSIRVGGWEMIRCATSLVFLISMIG
jgi:hypothetical protein